jgi:hypothetical protein
MFLKFLEIFAGLNKNRVIIEGFADRSEASAKQEAVMRGSLKIYSR